MIHARILAMSIAWVVDVLVRNHRLKICQVLGSFDWEPAPPLSRNRPVSRLRCACSINAQN